MLEHSKPSGTQIHTQVSIRMLKHVHAATHPPQLQKPEPLAKEEAASGLSKEELFATLALEAEEEKQEQEKDDGIIAPWPTM
jgi:integrase/recombinase XerD